MIHLALTESLIPQLILHLSTAGQKTLLVVGGVKIKASLRGLLVKSCSYGKDPNRLCTSLFREQQEKRKFRLQVDFCNGSAVWSTYTQGLLSQECIEIWRFGP